MNEQHINTQANIRTNKAEAVAGGLCDAPGPLHAALR